jgi:hypothetical protein
VKLQMLIVPVVAAAALTSGCASWDAHYSGSDYQCGTAGSNDGHYSALAGRQGSSGCVLPSLSPMKSSRREADSQVAQSTQIAGASRL